MPSATYEIRSGRIVTTIETTPFDVAAYGVGDKYLAARSNEFGCVHDDVEAVKRHCLRRDAPPHIGEHVSRL